MMKERKLAHWSVIVEHRGVDVAAALFGPDGKLAEANSAKGRVGTETVSFIGGSNFPSEAAL